MSYDDDLQQGNPADDEGFEDRELLADCIRDKFSHSELAALIADLVIDGDEIALIETMNPAFQVYQSEIKGFSP